MNQTPLNKGASEEETVDRIDPRTVVTSISPLLIDEEALRKAYRLKRSPFIQRKVHVADIDEAIATGWTVQKRAKRVATVQRKKPISQALEDRFWCLCRNMGYSTLNGTSLKVTFERENGTYAVEVVDDVAARRAN